jgi:hypothetical protein
MVQFAFLPAPTLGQLGTTGRDNDKHSNSMVAQMQSWSRPNEINLPSTAAMRKLNLSAKLQMV